MTGMSGAAGNPWAARDYAFYDQLTRAAASTTANIAEGFGRYHPKELAQFLRTAKAPARTQRRTGEP